MNNLQVINYIIYDTIKVPKDYKGKGMIQLAYKLHSFLFIHNFINFYADPFSI